MIRRVSRAFCYPSAVCLCLKPRIFGNGTKLRGIVCYLQAPSNNGGWLVYLDTITSPVVSSNRRLMAGTRMIEKAKMCTEINLSGDMEGSLIVIKQ